MHCQCFLKIKVENFLYSCEMCFFCCCLSAPQIAFIGHFKRFQQEIKFLKKFFLTIVFRRSNGSRSAAQFFEIYTYEKQRIVKFWAIYSTRVTLNNIFPLSYWIPTDYFWICHSSTFSYPSWKQKLFQLILYPSCKRDRRRD